MPIDNPLKSSVAIPLVCSFTSSAGISSSPLPATPFSHPAIRSGLLAGGVWLSLLSGMAVAAESDLRLWYDKPAADWSWALETLPIGNGKIGGMIFGGVHKEHVQFNEESLWLGDEETVGAYQAFGDLFVQFGGTSAPVVTCPSGQTASDGRDATSNHEYSTGRTMGYDVTAAFDGSEVSKWCVEHGNRPVICQIDVSGGQEGPVRKYSIMSAEDVPARDPKDWTFEGSDDGGKWTVIHQRTNEPIWENRHQNKIFSFPNNSIYTHYRFVFENTHDPTHFQVSEISFSPVGSPSACTDYKRELGLEDAVHRISYKSDGVTYRREYFCSYPDKVMVLRFTADQPNSYTGGVWLKDAHDAGIVAAGKSITATGSLAKRLDFKKRSISSFTDKPYNIGLNYESRLLVLNDGGTVEVQGRQLIFKGCNSLTMLLSAGTDYLARRDQGWKGEHPHERITADLKAASKMPFEELLKRHVKDYHRLFDRVAVDVGAPSDELKALTTDRRLVRYSQNVPDPDLEEMIFQYGRYLMIASSRPGCLPANLQGIWNQVNNPPWQCDYHSDVNLQMNYWMTGPANLSECFEPYSEWLWSVIPVRRDETAKDLGIKRGWMTRSENGLFGGATCGWVPGDAAWLAQNIWDHYAFSRDERYLRTRAYPIIKELCEFWQDYLIERPDGTLVSPKSVSPEHGPAAEGNSYEQQLVYDLFTNYMEAADILGVDQEFRGKVAAMRAHLLGPKVGKWGQLQEWAEDRDDPNDKHRHLVHLIAVLPGRQITPGKTPQLAEAAKVSLNARGDESNGWSMTWKVGLWARLGDGGRAHDILKKALRPCSIPGIRYDEGGGIYPSLLMACPPFQIEANFCYTSSFCEMLLQSHDGTIHLLPALPAAWPAGRVRGLVARGDYEVDIAWKDGKLTSAVIHCKAGNKPMVRISGGEIISDLAQEPRVRLAGQP